MTFARSLCATLCSPCLGSEYIPPPPPPPTPPTPGKAGRDTSNCHLLFYAGIASGCKRWLDILWVWLSALRAPKA